MVKHYFMTLVIFALLNIFISWPNLTGEQNAAAEKINKGAAGIELNSQEEAELIEHLEELEDWELIEDMEMLQNLEILENMEAKTIPLFIKQA